MIVPTIGPSTANIMLVGEAPGYVEGRTGKPFVQTEPAGRKLDFLLQAAGTTRHECLIANVAREQPPGNNMSFYYEDKRCILPKPILKGWIQQLKEEIERFRPNIVVALGRHALFALTGLTTIKEFRGYILESTLVKGQKVIPTWHPQATNYEYKLTWEAVMDMRKIVKNSTTPDLPKDERHLQAGVSKREFLDYMDYLIQDFNEPIALDIETTCNVFTDIIGLADSPNHAMSLALLSGSKPRYRPEEEIEIWRKLGILARTKEFIMHNGLYDYAVLWHKNHILFNHFKYDTMVATHVVWPEVPRSLRFISSICLNVPAWKHTSKDFPVLYNCADVANTYGCWRILENEISKMESWDTFYEEMRQIEPSTFLHLYGQYVDKELQKELLVGNAIKQKEGLYPRLKRLKEEISKDLGKEVNLRSPKQLAQVLYIDMRLPIQYKRRKTTDAPKTMTTDAEALKKLTRISNNPVLGKIVEWKKVSKLIEFVDIPLSPDSRVHTSYNITGATMARESKGLKIDDEDSYKSFARWSSSKSIILPYGSGNLQNIPNAARVMYKAPEGYSFVRGDYCQAEAVVVAYIINDQKLISLFKHSFGLRRTDRTALNLDVHKLTGAQMFGISVDQVTDDIRRIGKTLRHATNYSAGPNVVSSRVGCNMQEAKKLLEMFFNMCPQLRLWHNSIQQSLRTSKILINLFGRKHWFLDRYSDALFRSAYSYNPQSTVGDLLNRALCDHYYQHGEWITLAFQLHDAMYDLVPDNLVPRTIDSMRRNMIRPIFYKDQEFYIDVDFAVGKSWGELEEIEWQDFCTEETIQQSANIRSKLLGEINE